MGKATGRGFAALSLESNTALKIASVVRIVPWAATVGIATIARFPDEVRYVSLLLGLYHRREVGPVFPAFSVVFSPAFVCGQSPYPFLSGSTYSLPKHVSFTI